MHKSLICYEDLLIKVKADTRHKQILFGMDLPKIRIFSGIFGIYEAVEYSVYTNIRMAPFVYFSIASSS